MMPAVRIIEMLGGTRKAAALLGKPPSTVQAWKEGGFVPARAQAEVVEAARSIGVTLVLADFIGQPAPATPTPAVPAEAAA